MEFIVLIYYFLFSLSLIYALYFGITGLFGFRNYKKMKYAIHKPKYKFGVVIPVRNEEKVIAQLIDSLKKQNYPNELFEIIAVPNNCTDNTEKVAKKAGATILKPDVPVRIKGDALENIFAKLVKQDKHDAYIVFDADNLVHPDFLARMNDALCEGAQVAQGFRDAKNMSDSWVTGSYTIFYFIQNFFYNRARMNYSGSATINGTGFMMKKDVIKDGFHTVTITEDSEFTGQCALRGIQVAFVENAITYDEHPVDFKSSWKQRKRWTSGTLDCLKVYGSKLMKQFFKTGNIACFDMALMYAAPIIMVLSFMLTFILYAFNLFGVQLFDLFSYMYALGLVFFAAGYVLNIIMNIFVIKYNNKSIKSVLSGVFLFTFFLLSWIPINIICLFKRTKEWEAIVHDRNNIDLDKLIR